MPGDRSASHNAEPLFGRQSEGIAQVGQDAATDGEGGVLGLLVLEELFLLPRKDSSWVRIDPVRRCNP